MIHENLILTALILFIINQSLELLRTMVEYMEGFSIGFKKGLERARKDMEDGHHD